MHYDNKRGSIIWFHVTNEKYRVVGPVAVPLVQMVINLKVSKDVIIDIMQIW